MTEQRERSAGMGFSCCAGQSGTLMGPVVVAIRCGAMSSRRCARLKPALLALLGLDPVERAP